MNVTFNIFFTPEQLAYFPAFAEEVGEASSVRLNLAVDGLSSTAERLKTIYDMKQHGVVVDVDADALAAAELQVEKLADVISNLRRP